jgi:hypothetical protein
VRRIKSPSLTIPTKCLSFETTGGSAGFMLGTVLAAGIVTHIGLDRTIGPGGFALAVGSLAMVAAVTLGLTSGRCRKGSRAPCLRSGTALAVRSETVSRAHLPAICDLQGDFQKLQGEPILLTVKFSNGFNGLE